MYSDKYLEREDNYIQNHGQPPTREILKELTKVKVHATRSRELNS